MVSRLSPISPGWVWLVHPDHPMGLCAIASRWGIIRDRGRLIASREQTTLPGLDELSSEEALATLKALFRSTSGYVVYRLRRVDPEVSPLVSEVEVVSPSVREIMGVDDPQDVSTWFARVHRDDLPRVMAAQMKCFHDAVPFDEVFRMTLDEGERWIHAISHPVFDDAGNATHYNGLVVDVTARVAAEREAHELRESLDRAQRWEALGALAASVAHDFNNLLQGVLASAAMAQRQPGLPVHASELMGDVVSFVRRGASLTRDLLGYARGQSGEEELVAVDVLPSVQRVGRLVGRMFPTVEVETVVPTTQTHAAIDPGQLDQVLLNLCVNAAQASGDGGHVTVSVTRSSAVEATARLGTPITDPMVVIAVEDDGAGIGEAERARIFESFYTTKGDGTGLGLTTARRIVERWAGILRLAETSARGSTFEVLIPEERGAPQRADVAPPKALTQGIGVLLVDDEERLRRLLARYLTMQGFDVVTAGDYDGAVVSWRAEPERFHAIVTDTVMPGRGGLELVRQIRADRPDIPVVVISGQADDVAIKELSASRRTAFLGKPFGLQELVDTITVLTEE